MAVLLFLRRPRELGSYTHLVGLIDAAHVLAGQSRAAEGLLGVLAVTLENLGLQISTDGVILIPPGNKNRYHWDKWASTWMKIKAKKYVKHQYTNVANEKIIIKKKNFKRNNFLWPFKKDIPQAKWLPRNSFYWLTPPWGSLDREALPPNPKRDCMNGASHSADQQLGWQPGSLCSLPLPPPVGHRAGDPAVQSFLHTHCSYINS